MGISVWQVARAIGLPFPAAAKVSFLRRTATGQTVWPIL